MCGSTIWLTTNAPRVAARQALLELCRRRFRKRLHDERRGVVHEHAAAPEVRAQRRANLLRLRQVAGGMGVCAAGLAHQSRQVLAAAIAAR
jgi:hypothetical protein